MRIKGCKTIAEYKEVQRQHINKWVDDNFIKGSVSWEFADALHIKVIDKTGDSMIVSLDEIEQQKSPLFLDYRRRLSDNSVKTRRPGTHGRLFAGSACQRPAGIELRTANKPLQVLIQGKAYPVKIFYRVAKNQSNRQSGTKIAKRKKGFLLKAKSIF